MISNGIGGKKEGIQREKKEDSRGSWGKYNDGASPIQRKMSKYLRNERQCSN